MPNGRVPYGAIQQQQVYPSHVSVQQVPYNLPQQPGYVPVLSLPERRGMQSSGASARGVGRHNVKKLTLAQVHEEEAVENGPDGIQDASLPVDEEQQDIDADDAINTPLKNKTKGSKPSGTSSTSSLGESTFDYQPPHPLVFHPNSSESSFYNLNSPNTASFSAINVSKTPTRSIIMSSVDPSVSITNFLDCVKFGPIESARIAEDYPDPGVNSIALTFLKVETCLHFYNNLLTYFAKFKDSIHSPDLTINFANCKKLLPFIANAINNDGATRNVYIGNLTQLNRHISTEFLSSELTKFGIIDKIDLIDKGTGEEKEVFAFVHFTNVASAIKAVEQLSFSSEWENCKIFYGPDRCSVENDKFARSLTDECYVDPPPVAIPVQTPVCYSDVYLDETASAYGQTEGFGSELCESPYSESFHPLAEDSIVNALNQKSVTAAAVASTSGGLENIGNRTICISNLDPSTKVEDICNTVRGGLLQVIRFLPERKMCFMTFVEAEAAAQFFANANIHPIILHSRRLKIGWGHHSGQLPNSIQLEVSAGASRNVYIGQSTESADAENDEVLPDEAIIRKDFSSFGEVEQINFIKDNKAVFVNFLNISHAIKVVKDANGDFENDFHEYFENRYRGFKINFGKDRCGNPPKARKKKKPKKKRQRTETSRNDRAELEENYSKHETFPVELFASMGISSSKPHGDDGDNHEPLSPTESHSSNSSQLEIITSQPYTPTSSRPHYNRTYSRGTRRSNSQSFISRAGSTSSFGSMYYPDDRLQHPQHYQQNNHGLYSNLFATTGSQIMAQYLAQTQHANMLYAANVLNMAELGDDYRARRRK